MRILWREKFDPLGDSQQVRSRSVAGHRVGRLDHDADRHAQSHVGQLSQEAGTLCECQGVRSVVEVQSAGEGMELFFMVRSEKLGAAAISAVSYPAATSRRTSISLS